jgi:hypothetical protein
MVAVMADSKFMNGTKESAAYILKKCFVEKLFDE